jgi:DNA invertase Pin-like site-specific DNA recombinase
MSQDIGYKRVSSVDQNEARQLMDIKLDKVFTDKRSGKDRNRPALTDCLEWCREGDTLHVHSIDRLARNLVDLQSIVNSLIDKGVNVQFHKESLSFSGKPNPMNKLMLQMMGAFAEFERSMIRERQKEGIQAAQKAGKQIGAKPKLTPEQVAEAKIRISEGESKSDIAKALNVSRPTLYKALSA